jgi:alpha-methylacyl-CoA racemase
MPRAEHNGTGNGPLSGIRVVEIGSIGPGPFCAMVLADLGADALRVDRASGGGLVGPSSDHLTELLNRGRRSIAVDLKHPEGPEVVLRLVERADVLIEGFRPGVTERLGIGPEQCRERNPRLVYGRMTGYGQDGPMAQAVGHDLNYIALSGVLGMIGRRGQPPTPPLSLVGDFGGGGLMLALGILAALVERERSGLGQVIDASMVEGSALLATPFFGYSQTGAWSSERGTNIVDSGAPFYDIYETADGRWLSVAAMEPHFYSALLEILGLTGEDLPDQHDRARWPELKSRFAEIIRARTRDQWCAAAEGVEACVAPVLGVDEVEADPHLTARRAFVRHEGLLQPAPAPRFSRTPAALSRRPPLPGEHTAEALSDWGFGEEQIADLQEHGAIGRAEAEPVTSKPNAR